MDTAGSRSHERDGQTPGHGGRQGAHRPAHRRAARAPSRRPRRLTKFAFYGHLWLGILSAVLLLVISLTGVLLNHKRGLGLMPDVPHEPVGDFAAALPLAALADTALRRAAPPGATAAATIDRMDVRPRDGYVKVRMRDSASTEVTVDLTTGRVLHVGPRGDVFLEKLHSGEIFGDGWILLSDAAAVLLVIVLITGYWLWLVPKRVRRAGPQARGPADQG